MGGMSWSGLGRAPFQRANAMHIPSVPARILRGSGAATGGTSGQRRALSGAMQLHGRAARACILYVVGARAGQLVPPYRSEIWLTGPSMTCVSSKFFPVPRWPVCYLVRGNGGQPRGRRRPRTCDVVPAVALQQATVTVVAALHPRIPWPWLHRGRATRVCHLHVHALLGATPFSPLERERANWRSELYPSPPLPRGDAPDQASIHHHHLPHQQAAAKFKSLPRSIFCPSLPCCHNKQPAAWLHPSRTRRPRPSFKRSRRSTTTRTQTPRRGRTNGWKSFNTA